MGYRIRCLMTLLVLTSLGCTRASDTDEVVYEKFSSTIEGDSLKERLRVRVNPWTSSLRYIQEGGSLGKKGSTLVALPVRNIELILPGGSQSECTVYDMYNWNCFLDVTGPTGIENSDRWWVRSDTLYHTSVFSFNDASQSERKVNADTVIYVRIK